MSLEVRRSEIEEELKRALPAYGEVTEFHPLTKGHGHQSFVLQTSSKTNLYGSNPLTTKKGRVRYHLWFGLELLSGLVYWKKTDQSGMLADYQRRFRHWLRQSQRK